LLGQVGGWLLERASCVQLAPRDVHAIETYLYMPGTPILSQLSKLDSDSWGPEGLLQLYFSTHLKAALLSEPPDAAITSFGLPEDVDVAFQLNETQQLFAVRGWVESGWVCVR
jgi:hypothetical protein